ncbi:MAG TPA: hypothetical protein VI110_04440, partial [Lapillicoccus sp.]
MAIASVGYSPRSSVRRQTAPNAMELRYVRDVERAHGLPAGRRQRPAPGGGPERHDVAYDEQQVLVELD